VYNQVKKIFHIGVCFAWMCLSTPASLVAQTRPGQSFARVFVDCIECDNDYLAEELNFVSLVRDRLVADISVMITSLASASGGRVYNIVVNEVAATGSRADTAVGIIPPGATDSERRQTIARVLKVALLPFVRGKLSAEFVDIRYAPPVSVATVKSGSKDAWKQWVFRVGGSGSFADDESYSSRGADGSFSASNITDQLKFEFSAKGSFNREKFRLSDGELLTSDRHSWTTKSLVVRSLSEHLSIGLASSAAASVFQNTRLQMRALSSFEYDLFPYKQATQRQLIVRYGIGALSTRYVDTTIYQRIAESRPVHEFSAASDIKQPWGNVWGSALWSQYLHDLSKRRFRVETGVDWRIIAGLSLNVSVQYSRIRDQLNIRGSNLTDEERLLRLQEVQSGHSTSGGIGLSYTFGSVFSQVVNPRFRL